MTLSYEDLNLIYSTLHQAIKEILNREDQQKIYNKHIELIEERKLEGKMDKAIKSAKKSIDKKMDKLVKEDVKRDKKCDYDSKMARKKK